jgi:hypothetical protein
MGRARSPCVVQRSAALSDLPRRNKISAVTDDVSPFAIPRARVYEALAVADVALALSGHEVADYTRQLALRVARGDITAEEPVAGIIAHHTNGPIESST